MVEVEKASVLSSRSLRCVPEYPYTLSRLGNEDLICDTQNDTDHREYGSQ
jgi:hypothetical protein